MLGRFDKSNHALSVRDSILGDNRASGLPARGARRSKRSTFVTLTIGVAMVVGCWTRDQEEVPGNVDSGATDTGTIEAEAIDVGTLDAPEQRPKLPPPERKALGSACTAGSDCASGACVDGVCCDTPCSTFCFACNVAGSEGTCTFLRDQQDPSTPACGGNSVCSTDAIGVIACRLNDGEPCELGTECASGYCRSYYRDGDGDGYGTDSPETIKRCDATERPPQGFTAMLGDCCDQDPVANPGLPMASYFTTKNACGTFDWNCRNGEEHQVVTSCPTTGRGLACGQACVLSLTGVSTVLFVQACQ